MGIDNSTNTLGLPLRKTRFRSLPHATQQHKVPVRFSNGQVIMEKDFVNGGIHIRGYNNHLRELMRAIQVEFSDFLEVLLSMKNQDVENHVKYDLIFKQQWQ